MTKFGWAMGTMVVSAALAAGTVAAQRASSPSQPATGAVAPVSSHAQGQPAAQAPRGAKSAPQTNLALNFAIESFCVECHNDAEKKGSLTLEQFDIGRAASHLETVEKMIRKLQAGMMPPPGVERPDPETYSTLIATLEAKADAAALAKPNPGTRTFQRLNRPEYANTIRDLLALDVDAGAWLPQDTKSLNFDNIADEQGLSATLLESYLNAAADISRMAIGDRNASVAYRTYTNTSYVSQHPWDYVPGAPFGTRGGLVTKHVFPADAEYTFELTLTGGDNSRLENIDVSIDGARVALVRYETLPSGAADGRGAISMYTEPLPIKAGQHVVAAAFVRRFDGPYEDMIRPHDWSYAGGGAGGSPITTLPHLRDVIIRGPYRPTGVSETPSRRKVFSCRPTTPAEERPCARTIVSRLGETAYRRPLASREVDGLMAFYDAGATKAGFEAGVRHALEAILASPHFVFRLERQPATVRAGEIFRLSDYDMASRLSFFLWGTPPDQELLAAASRGELTVTATLEKQARRMLADPRADALGPRFAGQWLRLQDIDKVHPDPNFYPNFDEQLAGFMRRETELFFVNMIREDRNLLDLLRADYSFLNEKLAQHYGIGGVAGTEFRRVKYPDDTRRGLLGQGSMLVQTSFANRTSPVLRGKWVMEVLMGTPPPPPPQDGSVPPLEKTAEAKDGRPLTTRARLELHRENPTCNACHRFMDPIGLALDNFDVTAKWRKRESGMPLDTRGDFYDGSPVNTPAELSAALLKRPIPIVRTFTENLMAYALGRRVEYFDQPAIRAITKAAAANDYKLSSLILGVVKSDAFRMKRADADDTEPTRSTGRK